MGSKTRKAQCTTLYVCDSNTEERSIKLRSILGVLPCSILRIWRLWARTKNEYTADDFSMLTIREPWLLEKNFYFYRFHLASRKGIDATRSSWFTTRDQFDRDFQKIIMRKGRLIKEFPQFLVRIMALCGNFRMGLLTPLLISQILRFWQLLILKVQYFSKLMQCVCLCGMVLMMHVRMTRLPICVSDCNGNQSRERICVTSCYLTTKIPSALLVAVRWL
jgi:hypothetical protein